MSNIPDKKIFLMDHGVADAYRR